MQLFHRFLEHDGLPTWQSLCTWLAGDGADYLWTPYRQQLGFEQSTDAEKQMIRDGTAWRLGNSYYSALREIDIMISLRDAGLPMKYYMLADALFAVDFWRENRLVSVFIDNEQFKSIDGNGRKLRPERIFGSPQYYCRDFEIFKRRTFGNYWPVAKSTILSIADFLVESEPN